ncbi:MAG: hypothetical protein ACK4SI_10485 [Brevundimonas aurantiaca]|uniref:hypothetical protein n=1 Tax=Brevundimonas aurantiaca TaxID=74316 RepID=UPI003919A186
MSSVNDTPLVTIEDILSALQERDELSARLADLERKIEGIRAFIGNERFADIASRSAAQAAVDAAAQPKEPSFREVMLEALQAAPKGLTYDDLRQALTREGLGERLRLSPNTFFNTIARMVLKDEAVKVGGVVFTPTNYNTLSDDDKAALEGNALRHTTPEAIVQTLRDNKGPMNAAAIINAMESTHPEIKATAIYAALSRMFKDRSLNRNDEGVYSLPPGVGQLF